VPSRSFSPEPDIGPELADTMSKAYETVLAAPEKSGAKPISTQSIAQKIIQIAHEGRHDAESLAKAVLDSLKPGK